MKHPIAIYFVALCAAFTGAGSAFSHVVLQDGAAAAGAGYRATFQIGHGCDGSPTTGVKVSIPAGFTGAQPMPKAGWTARTVSGNLDQPYTLHGKTFTEGVVEISWSANTADNALPSDFYDEFVLRGTTPAKPGPLWFKVVQTCAKGSLEWVQVPATGTSTKGLKSPAALLDVLDVQAAGGHSH
ncbi:MAG: YcnI family protein [Pseudomonadota bacterium]